MKTLAILLGEHPCIVNILFGPTTVHYREVLLYHIIRDITNSYFMISIVLGITLQNPPVLAVG